MSIKIDFYEDCTELMSIVLAFAEMQWHEAIIYIVYLYYKNKYRKDLTPIVIMQYVNDRIKIQFIVDLF